MKDIMFIPTPQQQKIIDHFNDHGIVIAGPGSGKTVTIIAHVKELILEKEVLPENIWVMAFNRDISLKLKEKIHRELGYESPQVTTIHSFILIQTLAYGAQLLEGYEIAEHLGEYGKRKLIWEPLTAIIKGKHGITQTSEGKRLDIRHIKGILWTQLRDYWLTSEKPNDIVFDKYNFEIEHLKKIYKIVFLDELPLKFLDAIKANPHFRKEVMLHRIVIDEFQDLNPTEHGILQQFHKEGTIFLVFGDDDQAVNDFRRAHADYIHDFIRIYSPIEYPLARDRRCPKEILDLADEFVKGMHRLKKASGFAPHRGEVEIINFLDDDNEQKGIGDIVKKYISLFPQYDDNPQILILCGNVGKTTGQTRTSEIITTLRANGIDGVTGEIKDDPLDNEWGLAFKSLSMILSKGYSSMCLAIWLSGTKNSLFKEVNNYIENEERKGNSIDYLNAVFQLKKNNSKISEIFSEINNLRDLVKDDKFNPEIVINFIPNDLKGKKDAEELIYDVWESFQKDYEIKGKDSNNTRIESNKGHQFFGYLIRYINEDFRKAKIGRIHVTTYRKAKGLEADLVITTSVDSSNFAVEDQKRRLLYVAATRSKKHLILTFANKISGARRFTRGRSKKFHGVPVVYRSPLIPSNYTTQEYSDEWLNKWTPYVKY